MDVFYSIAVNLIFFTVLIEFALSAVFIFTGTAKRVMLNCCAMLLIIAPLFLRYNQIADIVTMSLVTKIGLCVYPVTLAFMIQGQYNQFRKTSIAPVYLLSSASFFAMIVSPHNSNTIIYVLLILFYLYIIYVIFPGKHAFTSVLLLAMICVNFIYLSVAVYLLNEIHLVLSTGLMSIITSLLLIFSLQRRLNGILRQFSALNDLNKKLNHRIARLKQSNDSYRKIILEKDRELLQIARHASLAELTTGIAHELAQPLTGIKGIAQNMIDDINMEEFEGLQGVSELLKICSLVDKSSSIIDHIRSFSKKTPVTMRLLNLNTVVMEAIDLINLQLKKNNIDLIFVLDEAIPRIVGDKISLEQLIINIVLNAKDAIIDKEFAGDDEYGAIRITTFASDGGVHLIIQDNGSGISEDIMNKIWSPFFTTKKREHGTGIGLSICSKILKEHYASVDIQSDKDGTQFSIRFPEEPPRDR